MAFLVRKRPNGEVVARCKTQREAIMTQSMFESRDLEYDKFEPDTYYINEVIIDE